MRHRHFLFTSIPVLALALCADLSMAQVFDLPEDDALWPSDVFQSAYKLIASESEMLALDTLQGEQRSMFIERFWKRRDPTPADPHNEFRDQFRERVEIARTRFRTVNIQDPWDDRGAVYIKFGEPDALENRVNGWYRPNSKGAQSIADKRDYGELWYYFDRNLALQFQGYLRSYELVPFVTGSGESQALGDYWENRHKIDTSQVAYDPPLGQVEHSMAATWYPFRRNDGNYDVYICSVFPVSAMARSIGRNKYRVDYDISVSVFDSALQSVFTNTSGRTMTLDGKPRGLLAQDDWGYIMKPGYYIVGCEVQSAEGSDHAARSFETWLVPYADTVALDLSPLVVASDVRPATAASSHFVRNGKEIVPMPNATFHKGQDVAFYHELYNLRPGGDGAYHYQTQYTLYDQNRNTEKVLLAQELTSPESSTFQAGRIPGDMLKKGHYILEVKMVDLSVGAERTALASLQVK
jgi:GWxTD domain-containing protein